MSIFNRARDAARLRENWRWLALVCYSTLLAALLARHIFWGDEIRAWNLAVYSDSLKTLFHQLPAEGHPILWYLVLRGAHVIWSSPQAMLVLQWLFASANAWLVLWYCPLPPAQRVCCCFGYYLLFEYGLLCRGYALGLLCGFFFLTVCGRYRTALIGPTLILALMVQARSFRLFPGSLPLPVAGLRALAKRPALLGCLRLPDHGGQFGRRRSLSRVEGGEPLPSRKRHLSPGKPAHAQGEKQAVPLGRDPGSPA